MAMAETVQSYLTQHQIKIELVPHPRTYSAHDSAQAAHIREDHIAKAVIVKEKVRPGTGREAGLGHAQGYAMVVIPGSNWLKLEALQQETDRDLQLAEEQVIDTLFKDCKPGAIPPLGPAYNIETFLDEQLISLANVYFEAGDHENLVHVSGNDLHALLKGVRHGHFSHNQ